MDLCGHPCKNLRGLTTHKRLAHNKKRTHLEKQPSTSRSPPSKKHKVKENKEELKVEKDRNEDKKLIVELKQTIADLENQLGLKNKEQNQTGEGKADDKTEILEEPYKIVERKNKGKGKNKTNYEKEESGDARTERPGFSQMFNCDICTEIFLAEDLLKKHMEQQHKEKRIADADEMVCHMKCADGSCDECREKKTCKLCKEKLKDSDTLMKHLKEKHPSTNPCKNGSRCQHKLTCRFHHEEAEVEIMEEAETEPEVEVMEQAEAGVVEMEENQKEETDNMEGVEEQGHKCNMCGQVFNTKREMSSHIKTSHKTFQPCKFFATNSCDKGSECRFNHIIPDGNKHMCYNCGTEENSKTDLMKHIKTSHGDIPCSRYRAGNCRFNSTSCIYSHGQPHEPHTAVRTPDFPQAWQAKPPDQMQLITIMVTEVMKEMLPLLIEQVNQKIMNRQQV